MNCYKAEFQGGILKRGFWIYVWQINRRDGTSVYYVGRTGDSSSANAASPFNRLTQHLDYRDNAKGNSMYRNLNAKGINPCLCDFHLWACGPIFPEQDTFENHKPYRDKIAALEYALAMELHDMGLTVIGTHGCQYQIPDDLKGTYREILGQVIKAFSLKEALAHFP